MDRRTTSAIVVLALAAIVVIAAWLLRADGAPAPVATVEPPNSEQSERRPAALPVPDAVPVPSEAREAPAASGAKPPETRPPAPRETGDFLIDAARQRARENAAKLRAWGPKGRVVEAGTGAPIAWKSATIQVRDRRNPAAVEIRGTDRGPTPEGDPDLLSRFDLDGSKAIRGDATPDDARPDSLEFRVVVQAWGYRGASTPWQPLDGRDSTGEITIAIERDESASIDATIRNWDGTAFRGTVAVDLEGEEGEYLRATSGSTDAEGRVRLEGIPSGEFTVTLRAKLAEAAGAWQCLHLSTEARRVVLPRGGTAAAEFVVPAHGEIEIAWADAHGVPVRGTGIRVKFAGGEVDYSSGPRRLIGLRPGKFDISLRAKDYRPWKTAVDVVAGQVTKVEARFEASEDPK